MPEPLEYEQEEIRAAGDRPVRVHEYWVFVGASLLAADAVIFNFVISSWFAREGTGPVGPSASQWDVMTLPFCALPFLPSTLVSLGAFALGRRRFLPGVRTRTALMRRHAAISGAASGLVPPVYGWMLVYSQSDGVDPTAVFKLAGVVLLGALVAFMCVGVTARKWPGGER